MHFLWLGRTIYDPGQSAYLFLLWRCLYPAFPCSLTLQLLRQGAKEDLEAAGLGGILLGGNYVAGVALGKCVEYGYEYANEITKYLSTDTTAAATNTEGDAFFV